jgi:hypothetical protein
MLLTSSDSLYRTEECDPVLNMSCLLDNNCSCWNSSGQELDDVEMVEEESSYIPYPMRPETYIVPVLFALIFVVGVLGNGTLVFIFIRNRNMRNVPNTYIFSLALGDLLVIVTSVPFTSTLYTVSRYFNPNVYRALIDSAVCMLRHLRSKESFEALSTLNINISLVD